MSPRPWILLALTAFLAAGAAAQERPLRVGSKNFTEQEILGEIVARTIEATTDLTVRRRFGLGGTDICHAAMRRGELDLYVEYTGTALLNVLGREAAANRAAAFLAASHAYRDRFDLEWLPPLGFNNTYAIAVRAEQARSRGWRTVSDLAADAADLSAGFTAEFMERPDGYPGLREAYGLVFGATSDLEPGLMYGAVAGGQVDVICAFATDARIDEYDLVLLRDDLGFFPPYDAAPVVRAEVLARHPEVRDALSVLAGALPDNRMRALNRAVDIEGRDPAAVAEAWVRDHLGLDTGAADPGSGGRPGFFELAWSRRVELGIKAAEHLRLTFAGTGLAVVIGIPLGVLVHRRARARGPVMALIEVMQTVPSLAMLAFLFALYGLLGAAPAITALVLYALLPIVLNTLTGLREVPRGAVEAARGMGMSGRQRLFMVELPLAAPVIIAGVRAATVLTVGIATLSTYIGAGGLGDFIARGLARNDPRLTLLGAAPAALMAVALSLGIRLLERATARV